MRDIRSSFWQPNSRHSDDGDVESKLRSKAPHSWENVHSSKCRCWGGWLQHQQAICWHAGCLDKPWQATVLSQWFDGFNVSSRRARPARPPGFAVWFHMVSNLPDYSRFKKHQRQTERERGVLSLAGAIFKACRDQCNVGLIAFNLKLVLVARLNIRGIMWDPTATLF